MYPYTELDRGTQGKDSIMNQHEDTLTYLARLRAIRDYSSGTHQLKVLREWESVDAFRAADDAFRARLQSDEAVGKITRKEYRFLNSLWLYAAIGDDLTATGELPTPEEYAVTNSLGVRTVKTYYRDLRKKGYIQLEGYTPNQVPVYTLVAEELSHTRG